MNSRPLKNIETVIPLLKGVSIDTQRRSTINTIVDVTILPSL